MPEHAPHHKMGHSFFELASFGKRMEFAIIADMLNEDIPTVSPDASLA